MDEGRSGPAVLGPPVSLDDYERLAQRVLDANAWAYLSGGSADEVTLGWNRDAFLDYAILPRVLRRSEEASTETELLGKKLAHPIIVGPVAFHRLFHADGEGATALAAAAQDSLMVLSTLATTPIAKVRRVEGEACRWFQVYFQERREDTLHLLRLAEEAGYEAIVLTVDASLSGVRNREQRVDFHLPAEVASKVAIDVTKTPTRPEENLANRVFREFLRVAPTWEDVRWLISSTSLPVVVKGIAAPADALLALECGAKALVVSNHGGRTLDTMPATLDLLPGVVDAIGGRIPVLMDGGIRRGTDVFKALALGASAVMVGRPVIYGLAVGGAMGVSHVLRILRDELGIAMVLSGAMTIPEINRDYLVPGRGRSGARKS